MTVTAISACVRVSACVFACNEPSNTLNQGPQAQRKWQLLSHSDNSCGRDVSVPHYERLQLWDVWCDQKMSGFWGEFCLNTMIMGSVFMLMPAATRHGSEFSKQQLSVNPNPAWGSRQLCGAFHSGSFSDCFFWRQKFKSAPDSRPVWCLILFITI